MSGLPRLRRVDRQMPEEETIALLEAGFCGRLGTVGPDGFPYVVPLLYVWMGGQIFVHNTAATGHLRRNVEHDSRVCFEVDVPGEIFPYGRFECDTSVSYQSAIAFGRIQVVEDRDLKVRFCEALMQKYGDTSWERPEGFFPRLDQITVYAIEIERLTGKRNPLPIVADQWPSADRTKSPGAIAPAEPK